MKKGATQFWLPEHWVPVVLHVARVGLLICLVVASAYYLSAYLWIALSRMTYPYELEWLEGVCLNHVGRLADGHSLYVAPSVEFIPYLYTPFFFELSALVSKFTGLNHFCARIVSFTCSIGLLRMLFVQGRSLARSWFGGLLAVGLFVATFRFFGALFDLGRVSEKRILERAALPALPFLLNPVTLSFV